jgi:hypothetical protein
MIVFLLDWGRVRLDHWQADRKHGARTGFAGYHDPPLMGGNDFLHDM